MLTLFYWLQAFKITVWSEFIRFFEMPNLTQIKLVLLSGAAEGERR